MTTGQFESCSDKIGISFNDSGDILEVSYYHITALLERGVRVLDSPGVVFDDDDQESSNILLRNVLKVEDIMDPIEVGMCSFGFKSEL